MNVLTYMSNEQNSYIFVHNDRDLPYTRWDLHRLSSNITVFANIIPAKGCSLTSRRM